MWVGMTLEFVCSSVSQVVWGRVCGRVCVGFVWLDHSLNLNVW